MKAVLLIALILFSAVTAYERLWAKGDVLLGELQNGRDELHVAVFYDSTNTEEVYGKVKENDRVIKEVMPYLDTISEGGEKPFPVPVFLSTVDAVDPYNNNIIFKSGFNTTALDDGPVVLALRHQTGYVQYGAKVVAALRDSVEKLREVTP